MARRCDRYLPEELVIDILSRLPVKSLIRFQCVSKDWYNLIKSPVFIDKHFHHPHNQTRLFLNSRIEMTTNKYAMSVLFPDDTPMQHHYIDTHYLPQTQTLSIEHGPINGIFLLKYYETSVEQLALWNPASKEFRVLPPLPRFPVPTNLVPCSPLVGFGLDPVTKVYKVVSIQNYRDEYTLDIKYSVVGLYTLDIDSWTQKEIHPVLNSVGNIWYDSSTFLDGVYYWVSGKYEVSIVLFDMANEEFQEIEGPPNAPRGATGGELTLHNYDSIALLLYSFSDDSFGMWIMKPKERFWTKHFDIGLVRMEVAHGFWNKDLMIVTPRFSSPAQLAVYYPTNYETRNLPFYGYHFRVFFNYKESLYSLKL